MEKFKVIERYYRDGLHEIEINGEIIKSEVLNYQFMEEKHGKTLSESAKIDKKHIIEVYGMCNMAPLSYLLKNELFLDALFKLKTQEDNENTEKTL